MVSNPIIIFFLALDHNEISKVLKQEGETCGPCFSPSSEFDCGECALDLKCVEHELVAQYPDLPSTCKSKTGNYTEKNIFSSKIFYFIGP